MVKKIFVTLVLIKTNLKKIKFKKAEFLTPELLKRNFYNLIL